MKVIIAGSRDFSNYKLLKEKCDFYLKNLINPIIVSGKCPTGADYLGEKYAKEKGYEIKPFPANWKDLSEPCLLKFGKFGAYNALAGHKRNEQMAEYADALILFWDGKVQVVRICFKRQKIINC